MAIKKEAAGPALRLVSSDEVFLALLFFFGHFGLEYD